MVSPKDGFALRFKFNSLAVKTHFVTYPKQLKLSCATIFKQKKTLFQDLKRFGNQIENTNLNTII
jgi:hypothetical protein